MTGEMLQSDVTREAFPLHFAMADAVGGTVQPFDVYQGPYVLVGADVRIGAAPYAVAPRGLGVVRLWLCSDDGAICTVYNEATEEQSPPFMWDDEAAAVEAALMVTAARDAA